MTIKALVALMLGALTLALAACAPGARTVPLTLTYDDFTRNKNQTVALSIHPRDTVEITIPSNPSTGYRWELGGISPQEVIAQGGDSEYVLPESQAPGAGGQEIWSFKALKRGPCTISLNYSQAWEGGTKNAWTLVVNVTVK
jgi:inhibitor of cysteine peptidase